MTEISGFYVRNGNYAKDFIFIKFEKYFIIYIEGYKKIILSYETFMNIPYLFDLYIISLILVEDLHIIYHKKHIGYNIKNKLILLDTLFTDLHHEYVYLSLKNLLNKCEPKRQSSNKKIRKSIKNLNRDFETSNPKELIERYISTIINETDKKINYYNTTFCVLTGIRKKYGEDIYDQIRNYL